MGSWQFVRLSFSALTTLTEGVVSLTNKLPFEDDEFDHVHVHAIAQGVPENKVNTIVCCCRAPSQLQLVGHLI
jgi:hypothetical protein